MRRIVVTGANKGIGLAIVEGILDQWDDTFVYLGSRDRARGEDAVRGLLAARPQREGRVRPLPLDVTQDASVAEAVSLVRADLPEGERLYGIVNNAGIGLGDYPLSAVLETNVVGMQRVCEAFLPLLPAKGARIVNVTSAAGPNFVAKCSPERQRFFTSGASDWDDLQSLMQTCIGLEGDPDAFAERGLGDGEAYGLSKACANTYTLQLARRYPAQHVNACTPGFIETDLTRSYAAAQGKTPADLGMKPPSEGARCPLHLLFAELEGNGRYYGSDCERSPLDRYRAPGSPAYTGD